MHQVYAFTADDYVGAEDHPGYFVLSFAAERAVHGVLRHCCLRGNLLPRRRHFIWEPRGEKEEMVALSRISRERFKNFWGLRRRRRE
jgi:hypothetical protein